MELISKRLLTRQKIHFDKTHLFIDQWNLVTGRKNWYVRFDEIDLRINRRQSAFFSTGCAFAVCAVIISTLVILYLSWLTTLVILVIALTPMLIARGVTGFNYVEFHTRLGPVILPYDKGVKVKTDVFLEALQVAVKDYMLVRYGTIDTLLSPAKQAENLWWLRNNGYLTDEEYGLRRVRLEEMQKNQNKN